MLRLRQRKIMKPSDMHRMFRGEKSVQLSRPLGVRILCLRADIKWVVTLIQHEQVFCSSALSCGKMLDYPTSVAGHLKLNQYPTPGWTRPQQPPPQKGKPGMSGMEYIFFDAVILSESQNKR
jgi:hypothetical protein